MAYEGGADYDRMLRVLYYIVAIVMLLNAGYLVFLKPRTPDPANNKAFGCYTTTQAAPILLNKRGMTILQRVPIPIGYHLERHKTGIALTADSPIAAEPAGTKYVFSIRPPGDGWYLDFFNEIKGHSYGDFDESDLRQFTMLAMDGKYLPYRKAPPSDCGG